MKSHETARTLFQLRVIRGSSYLTRESLQERKPLRLMPDIRKHRGAHPEDRKFFAEEQVLILCTAVSELSWLLTRDYSLKGALKLVGDRYTLTNRQRLAVARAACSDQSKERRAAVLVDTAAVAGQGLIVDGFNLIITVEAALSGGLLMLCRDGCIRDLSSVHGSYRAVDETETAIQLIGEALESLHPRSVEWLLDSPISNSGRLAQRIRDLGDAKGWNWKVETLFNPDAVISKSKRVVISSDSHILDGSERWLNFNRHLVAERLADSWLIDLSC